MKSRTSVNGKAWRSRLRQASSVLTTSALSNSAAPHWSARGMGRARQESYGFVPGIALYIPVTGRSVDPFTKGVNLRTSAGDHQFRDDLGLCRGRPVLPPFSQRDYAGFRELADFPGKPPCNCRGLFQPGDYGRQHPMREHRPNGLPAGACSPTPFSL